MRALSMDQITGSNFSYQNFTFEHFLDDMVKLEREHLELWGIAQHLSIEQFSFSDARRMRGQLNERGQNVVCVTPEQIMYPVNLASSVKRIRTSSIAMFEKAVEVCVELGSPLLFMTPGRGFENESRDDAWKRAVDGVGDVVDYAEAAGVRCGLEPLQRHESNLVNNSLQLAQMIDEIGSVNLYAALDTVAMATAGETVAGYVERFGSRIQHVHVIDGKPAGHLAWGDGNLPLDEYLRELGEADYAGYLSFEIFGTSNAAEPFDAHSRSLNAVRTALAA